MLFADRPATRISESNAVRFLARAIPYLRLRRRKGTSQTLIRLSEVASIYADFIPHADKIKVEPLDEFYTYEAAVGLIDADFLKFLMLKAPGNRVSWQTISAWLVLLSGKAELSRVFMRCISKLDISDINKELVELVLDDGRGRTIKANNGIYEHLDVVRAAIVKAAPLTTKRKVVLASSREGRRAIKAFKKDLPKIKELYHEEGAVAAVDWVRTRSWYWYYADLDGSINWRASQPNSSQSAEPEWHWGYWL